MLWKTLAKFLLPGLGGGGIVTLTMHLTNTAGNLLNSMLDLDLKDKPIVPEDEIQPIVKQEEKEEKSENQEEESEQNSEQPNSTDPSQQQNASQGSESATSQSTPSTESSSGKLTPEEIIKLCALDIRDNSDDWTSLTGTKSLRLIHHLHQTIHRFTSAIQQHEATTNTNQQK